MSKKKISLDVCSHALLGQCSKYSFECECSHFQESEEYTFATIFFMPCGHVQQIPVAFDPSNSKIYAGSLHCQSCDVLRPIWGMQNPARKLLFEALAGRTSRALTFNHVITQLTTLSGDLPKDQKTFLTSLIAFCKQHTFFPDNQSALKAGINTFFSMSKAIANITADEMLQLLAVGEEKWLAERKKEEEEKKEKKAKKTSSTVATEA